MRLEVLETSNGYVWQLKSATGRVSAHAPRIYSSQSAARNAAVKMLLEIGTTGATLAPPTELPLKAEPGTPRPHKPEKVSPQTPSQPRRIGTGWSIVVLSDPTDPAKVPLRYESTEPPRPHIAAAKKSAAKSTAAKKSAAKSTAAKKSAAKSTAAKSTRRARTKA